MSDKGNLISEITPKRHCVRTTKSERRAFFKTSIQKRLWHFIKHFSIRVCLNFFMYLLSGCRSPCKVKVDYGSETAWI